MSSTLTLPEPPAAAPLSPAGVQRTALYLESQRQWLFAWLHRPTGVATADHGVVICPPVGHEQIHAHRSLRHLADALAAAGFPTLRFDYHGTGDSGGTEEEADRIATWLANVRDVHDWLKQHLACWRVSMVGVRLGAALAAQAAAAQGVESLVLWAPVVKGRSWVREMKALSLGAGEPPAGTASDLEAGGFVLTEQTAQEVSRLDLLQVQPRCRRALIIARDDLPADAHLLEHLRRCAVEAEQTAQPGYAGMMAEPHLGQVPEAAIACAVEWLRAAPPPEAGSDPGLNRTHIGLGGDVIPPGAARVVGGPQSLRERVLRIGDHPRLFGILTEPAREVPADLPAVVLVNAGSAYRVGPNRLYVFLARQLAAHGFRCCRVDLAGLGDSVAADLQRENDPYPATAFRDMDLILRHLQSEFQVGRAVLLGLCSGAYAAFQAAVQLPSRLLVESVLINPLTFFWQEGMSLETAPVQQLQSWQDGLASLWQPGKWLKLLAGRSKLGLAGALRLLLQRWTLRPAALQKEPASTQQATLDGFPAHPLKEDLPGDLERVVQADRHLSFFFARSDPGHGLLTFHARRKVAALQRAGRLSLHFLDGADHTFSRRAARGALAQALIEHLTRRYLVR